MSGVSWRSRDFQFDPNHPAQPASDLLDFAVAVIGRRGEVVFAEPEFLRLFSDRPPAFELARLSGLGSPQCAIGLVDSAHGWPVAVLAMDTSHAAQWPIFGGYLPAVQRQTVMLAVCKPAKFAIDALAAARAFGLTRVEAMLIEGLIRADDLKEAGASLGLGRETAKDVLRRAMRKMGALNAAQATGQAMDLACDIAYAPALSAVQNALSLSPAEARVALRIGAGDSALEAGHRVGMTPGTVKSYRRTIFTKTGVNRARHLGRLIHEVIHLARLSIFSEKATITEDRAAAGILFGPGGLAAVAAHR